MFRRQETRGQRPKTLVRRNTAVTITPKSPYNAIALIVSVESQLNPDLKADEQFCELCEDEISISQCRRDLKNVHEEADMIAQIYKRLDFNFLQLKDPCLSELEQAWKQCMEALDDKKVFFFAFVGHGYSSGETLSCVTSDNKKFAMEVNCMKLSAQTPVIAFFNCTRSVAKTAEAAETAPGANEVAKYSFVYACQQGQRVRSFNSTQHFCGHFRG